MAKLSLGRQELIGIDNIPQAMVKGLEDLAGAAVLLRGAYSSTVAYKKNDVVTSDGKVYLALKDAPSGTALTDTGTYILFSGEAGAQGEKGNDGERGAEGPQGPKGNDGARGTDGQQGQQGPKGNDGAAGGTGQQGPRGLPGNDGAAGGTGQQGPRGLQGLQGEDGEQGEQGASGATFPTNASTNDVLAWDGSQAVSVNKEEFGISDHIIPVIAGHAITPFQSRRALCDDVQLTARNPRGGRVNLMSFTIPATFVVISGASGREILNVGAVFDGSSPSTVSITGAEGSVRTVTLLSHGTFDFTLSISLPDSSHRVSMAFNDGTGEFGISSIRFFGDFQRDIIVINFNTTLVFADGTSIDRCFRIENVDHTRVPPSPTTADASKLLAVNSAGDNLVYINPPSAPTLPQPNILLSRDQGNDAEINGATRTLSYTVSAGAQLGYRELKVRYGKGSPGRITTADFPLNSAKGTYLVGIPDGNERLQVVFNTNGSISISNRAGVISVRIFQVWLV